MGRKKKYKLFKDGQYIGEFYSGEICEMAGITLRTFYAYASNGQTYKGRYQFEGEQGANYTQKELEFMAQWDKYRKLLNPDVHEEVTQKNG